MATSDVNVVNVALAYLGDQAVTSLTDDSDRARAMNLFYLPTLDAKLREHSWNFAQIRVALQQINATPAFEFTYMYQLPQDPLCLDVLETSLATDEPWRIETYQTSSASYRVLITDATAVSILYLARLTDVARWDSLFADAMSWELAARASYALSGKGTLTEYLVKMAMEAWRKAKSRDGQESRALKTIRSDALTAPRSGSWGSWWRSG